MTFLRRELTILLMQIAKITATTSATRFHIKQAIEYEQAFR